LPKKVKIQNECFLFLCLLFSERSLSPKNTFQKKKKKLKEKKNLKKKYKKKKKKKKKKKNLFPTNHS